MRRTALGLAVALFVTGAAAASTIGGTSADDRLVGTGRDDSIFGRAGNDRLLGLAGADFLHGGPGSDRLESGPGNDRIAVQYDGARDAVLCGGGVDVVNADLRDRVASDCELVSRRLSRDPYTDPTSQHETQVEPDSLSVGTTTVAAFQVGRRHRGAATNVGFAVSGDGGRTWRSGLLPGLTRSSVPAGPNDGASDPVVAFDAANGVWLIGTLAFEGPMTRLTVSRSSDGLTWGPPVVAIEDTDAGGITFDKNWLVCDNGAASPFRGRCYLVYTDTLRNDRLATIVSTDGGATWSTPAVVPVTDAVGAFPVVRPSGELVVVFLWSERRIGASVSADGGLTFADPVVVSDVQVRSNSALRFFPLPSADADRTGRVWVAWHDCRFTPRCAANSVVVSSSLDGFAWSPLTRVTSGRNAFLPAVGVHPESGRLALLYYVVGRAGIDAELVESRAGGPASSADFGAPRRLSAQTMRIDWLPTTTSGRMLADYVSVHYAGARPLAVWALASEPVGSSLRQAIYATRG
jgi:hypothetical protein